MAYLTAIVLGFVEGATEFIPVSSTGHLIVIRQFLGQNVASGLSFDAVLQFAAALALVFYFWKDIVALVRSFWGWLLRKPLEETDKVLLSSIILGTIPAVIAGLLLEDYMDSIFRNVNLVAVTLILGSILFVYAEKVGKQYKILSLGRGIIIGFFQCLALIPGISRSGATISGGLITGLTKDEAVRFSFLLSIPILLGSGLKKLFEVRQDLFSTSLGLELLLGSAVSFFVALWSIKFLIKYLKNHSLNLFVFYRIALSVAILWLL